MHYKRGIGESVGAPKDGVSWEMTRGPIGRRGVLDDQGNIEVDISGAAPVNEDGVREVCERLVRRLNADGASWGPVVEGDDVPGTSDVDAIARCLEDTSLILRMQVVRASNNGARWRALREQGRIAEQTDVVAVADELIEPIARKAAKYPADQKRVLTLVVDASQLASHTFDPVLLRCRDHHGQVLQAAGFAAVWVVGPADPVVFRLDI